MNFQNILQSAFKTETITIESKQEVHSTSLCRETYLFIPGAGAQCACKLYIFFRLEANLSNRQ